MRGLHANACATECNFTVSSDFYYAELVFNNAILCVTSTEFVLHRNASLVVELLEQILVIKQDQVLHFMRWMWLLLDQERVIIGKGSLRGDSAADKMVGTVDVVWIH